MRTAAKSKMGPSILATNTNANSEPYNMPEGLIGISSSTRSSAPSPLIAMSISEFCLRYSVGRTLAYELIAAGVLPAKKIGRRTLIAVSDAESWWLSAPTVRASGDAFALSKDVSEAPLDPPRQHRELVQTSDSRTFAK